MMKRRYNQDRGMSAARGGEKKVHFLVGSHGREVNRAKETYLE